MVKSVLILLVSTLLLLSSHAMNPIVPHVGQADPHVHVYNDTFYLYSTTDGNPQSKTWDNPSWRVWESSDLVVWNLVSTLLPNATPAQPNQYMMCWATDSAFKFPYYYFYISMGPEEIGVMRSLTPSGPWENALGIPLISQAEGNKLNTQARDPGVLVDDDGEAYLVFGTFNYFIAKLGGDMMSLAESPRAIVVLNATSQNGVGILDDKPFLHKREGRYFLSFGCFYGISNSPYGPFNYIGAFVDKSLISPDFRTNVTNSRPWWGDEDLNDRHGSFFSSGGQDFWSSNDRSHSGDMFNTNAFRDSILTYVQYFTNNTIAPVIINGFGVGEYDGTAIIEAETFMRILPLQVGSKHYDDEGRGWHVRALSGASIHFPHVRNVPRTARFLHLRVRRAANNTADNEVMIDISMSIHQQLHQKTLCAGVRVTEFEWDTLTCEINTNTFIPANDVTLIITTVQGSVELDRFWF
jgi:arabinoxylan arabinofuranohydrolase